MWHDNLPSQINFQLRQCDTLDEPAREKQLVLCRPLDMLEQTLRDMDLYEKKLAPFCGLWEDYPRYRYRMEFRLEMGQLIGYSNVNGSKALARFDRGLIHMAIIRGKETGQSIEHYRGRLGWNQKYIIWEKEDASRETGWRSTRRWVRVE